MLLVSTSLSACDLEALDFGGHLVSVGVTGATAVTVGDTIRLQATGQVDGLIGILAYDPLRDAEWSSADNRIATLTRPPASPEDTAASSAIIRGVSPGRVLITASARGISGARVILVTRIPMAPQSER